MISVSARIRRVREMMKDDNLDAVLVTNPSNRRYLSAFSAEDHADDESAGVVLITASRATLLVSPTNLPWARSEANDPAIDVEPYETSWVDTIAKLVSSGAASTLAVEDTTTPAASWFRLEEELSSSVNLIRIGHAVDQLRAVKSCDEQSLLKNASRMTDDAFAMATKQFRPGMTEVDAANIVQQSLQEAGSEGEAFDTIVASGLNAARPHHRPGMRQFESGEPIIIDMGARVDGYNGDLTRTVCLGAPDERLARVYEAVLEAQASGLSVIRAGERAATPDLATREVFARAELDRYVIHSAGHGLGLRIHEAPSIRTISEEVLETGHVVTMEPGLYIPCWGGVRIEDVVIVTEDGNENITSAPKGLDVMSI